MLIDWFTVSAQVVNFLVLVWLLKRFLYRPILDAIDAREQRIARELADADAKRAQARQERETFEQKNQAFDQQRAALLSQAVDAAQAEGGRLLAAARQSADALRDQRRAALQHEVAELNEAILRRTQQEVFAIARKTLTDLAGASLEERVVEVFTDRLRALDGPAQAVFAAALAATGDPVRVRSACELPPTQRAAIQAAIAATFTLRVPVQFETAPDLIGGIALIADGQQFSWTIADYLRSLEQGVGALLKGQDTSRADAQPEPAAPESAAQRP